VALARRVYIDNDKRAAIKRAINEAAGSEIVEEKSYKPYLDVRKMTQVVRGAREMVAGMTPELKPGAYVFCAAGDRDWATL
jgi:hypothetical protein